MNNNVNRILLPIVEKAGWYPNRKINLNKLRRSMQEYDNEFPLLDIVADFYKTFGELCYHFCNGKTHQEELIETSFDKASSFLYKGDITEEYMPKVSAAYLIPIGYWNKESCILLMDEQGKIYLGADRYFAMLGNCFTEALENIILGKEPLIII